jgi:hypothetical protein
MKLLPKAQQLALQTARQHQQTTALREQYARASWHSLERSRHLSAPL